MLFSSNIFVFIFLPAVILVYYTILRRSRTLQNLFLLLASLFFYAWGEPRFVLVMLLSIGINWFMGLLVDACRGQRRKAKLMVLLDVIFNLCIIFIFKYLMFTVANINALLGCSLRVPSIALPIGISFFTFQAISYVVDVYRGKGEVQKNLMNVGLYISFFPQLIAGPIVRYETVAYQIQHRKESFADFSQGSVRFIIGLGKKVLLSNSMAVIADYAFSMTVSNGAEPGSLSVCMAWLGAIAYTLQIFFDFSGYSDMAIGLGKMFGFHFLENFDYPYISKSATEFWRRWHMSLGTWFRDYVYIPLGGSRVKSRGRHIFNLFVVWLCTGIWHGANWTFILWGLMYFVLLTFEKFSCFQINGNSRKTGWCKHIYAMFFVIMGWVIFRAENIHVAAEYYGTMFGGGTAPFVDNAFVEYISQYAVYILAGILFSTPIMKKAEKRIPQNWFTDLAYAAVIMGIFIISVSFIVKGTYNPFIYFNF
ncbi:MAG: MBOAT family protein [Firmicutes bacterium]|nr:MBOAT family protein [Bacillota bacterium]